MVWKVKNDLYADPVVLDRNALRRIASIEVEVFLHNLSDEDLTCTVLGSTTHPFENEIEHFQFLKICAFYWEEPTPFSLK